MKFAMYVALAAGALVPLTAHAGQQNAFDVVVDKTNRSAYGAIGTARNSSDSKQLLTCEVTATSSSTTNVVMCAAQDAAGNFGMCTSTSAQLANLASTINSDSRIYFFWDTSGHCTSLTVRNSSELEPKR